MRRVFAFGFGLTTGLTAGGLLTTGVVVGGGEIISVGLVVDGWFCCKGTGLTD